MFLASLASVITAKSDCSQRVAGKTTACLP